MPWEVRLDRGVCLPQIGWWLDARRGVQRSFVTHAHSDHIGAHREIVCTQATALFMRARLTRKRTERILDFGQSEPIAPDCTATLHRAGHILGSAQVLLEHAEHGRLLYTGDFKLRRGAAAEECDTPATDVLVMETTFGLPRYVLPAGGKVEADIINFCRETLADGATPVLFAYSLGKTQELLQILGIAGIAAALPSQSMRLTRLYERLGQRFGDFVEFDRSNHAGRVVICPPGSSFLDYINPKRTAIVSGWALDSSARYRFGCDAAFPLSDHADFNELLRFVDLVRPKLVYTLHGFAREFAATLRSRGIEAWAVGQPNQTELAL